MVNLRFSVQVNNSDKGGLFASLFLLIILFINRGKWELIKT